MSRTGPKYVGNRRPPSGILKARTGSQQSNPQKPTNATVFENDYDYGCSYPVEPCRLVGLSTNVFFQCNVLLTPAGQLERSFIVNVVMELRLPKNDHREAVNPRAARSRHSADGVASRWYKGMSMGKSVWSHYRDGIGENIRRTTMRVAVHRGPPPQTRQDLNAVDPESGSNKEASDVFPSSDICTANMSVSSPRRYSTQAKKQLTYVKNVASRLSSPLSKQLPRIIIVNKLHTVQRKAMVKDDARKHPVLS
jgi:hypothetical protein